MKSLLNSITLGLLLVRPFTAWAQDIPVPNYTIVNQGRISSLILQSVIDDNQKNASNPNRRAAVDGRSVGLAYTPTAALKRQIMQGYIERLKTKNPVTSHAVATNFGSGKYEYGTIYNGLVKGNGLRENDAVDVLTAYMVLGYMIVHNVQDGNAVTPAMVQGIRAQFGPKLAQNPKLNAPGVAAQLGEEIKLQFVVIQGGWQLAGKERALPAYQKDVGALFKNQWGLDFAQLKLTSQGFASPERIAPRAAAIRTTGITPSAVEGWFFRAISGYPAAVSFEPVVLFKNRKYIEIGELPLELLDIPQDKKSRPAAWGTWQRKGAAYVLTNAQNQANEYKLGSGNWFPAYAYTGGITLKKGYERVSGVDYGGGTFALAITKLNFLEATISARDLMPA